ncbi:cyclic nucleotide-binding domain-containing protein [Kaarinaea lacus]
MDSLQAIKQLPFWGADAAHALDQLLTHAEVVHVDKGDVLAEQFKSATDFFLLCKGSVDYYVTVVADEQHPIPVGSVDAAWSVIGWSGINEPHRYTTQIRCAESCTLLRWDYQTLNHFVSEHPVISHGLLCLVMETSKNLLERSFRLLKSLPTSAKSASDFPRGLPQQLKLKLDPRLAINYLFNSSLFQEMTLHELKHLAGHCWLQRYPRGSAIFSEQALATDVMVLVKGKVDLYHHSDDSMTGSKEESKVFVRSLSQPGQAITWAALLQSPRQDVSAIAQEDVTVCCIAASDIAQYGETRPEFSIKLSKKLIQLIGNRLRAIRALLIRQQTRSELATITSLFHNVGPQLGITSPLHKVPYLLVNRATQEDAFSYLEHAKLNGSQFEKNIAALCLDLLTETRKETEFYQGLRSIYQIVVTAKKDEIPQKLRNRSAAEFAKVFSKTRYLILGEHHLPDSPGHIFIMNHLVSHPYHKLPNGFEFSLDTHFISSMILYKNYGDSGVRVVRKSRYGEYGHESYYQRLGHIYVYTKESELASVGGANYNWRDQFFTDAANHLQQRRNIIICPEGTSKWSADSPGEFKSGAFRLAAMRDPETLIVPVVVANFDKRLSETVLAAEVKQPFRISDIVDVNNRGAMDSFLADLRSSYKTNIKKLQKISYDYLMHGSSQ